MGRTSGEIPGVRADTLGQAREILRFGPAARSGKRVDRSCRVRITHRPRHVIPAKAGIQVSFSRRERQARRGVHSSREQRPCLPQAERAIIAPQSEYGVSPPRQESAIRC